MNEDVTASEHGSSPIGQEADVGKWQPIETAPKDEIRVIVCTDGGFVTTARWVPKFSKNHYDFDAPGWFSDSLQDRLFSEPTHWQPLPSPPTTSTAGR